MNKVDLALEVAAKAHRHQLRKGTDVPYIAHVCGVALILARAGCAEDVLVAGILHDTVEDTDLTLADIERDFGSDVAAIVAGCTEDKSLPWQDRKRHTIEMLRDASPEVRLVTCADKLHNARSILAERRRGMGEQVWERFREGKALQEWYYRGLAESLSGQNGSLFQEFRNAVDDLFGDDQP